MTVDFSDLIQPNSLTGTNYTWVDADTLADKEGKGYRIQGIDAPEIHRLNEDGTPWKLGTAGAGVATPTLIELANKNGYTNVVHTGEFDANGREIVRLQDSAGRDFSNKVLSSGILNTNRYTTNEDALSAEVGALLRNREGYEATEWDTAREGIQQAIEAETWYDAGFKEAAINEQDLSLGYEDSPGYVQFRNYDRDLDNQSLNPLSDAWHVGWTGVQEALWGVVELAGSGAENADWIKDMGEAGVTRARSRLAEVPQLKLSALDDKGNWDIDSIGEFFEYLGTNAAISVPYMAITVGGSLAAPFTGGLSLAAPAAVYTGQTWNEMEGEKNAGVAIAAGITQAALDRVGLKGLSGSLLKKETLEQATKALMAKNGISEAAAKNLIAQATRKEIAGFAGDAARVAAEQIKAGNIIKNFAKRAGQGAVTEGITEVLQEAVGYNAAVLGSDKEFDAVQLANRLANAAIAGGTLGGGFAVPGAAYDAGAWADVAVRQAPADANRLSRAGRFAQHEKETRGRIATIQELNDETDAAIAARKAPIKSFDERKAEHEVARRNSTVFETAGELWASIPGLWRGATRNIFTESLQNRSRAARKLADMFGGNLQRTFSGSNFENRKHHLVSQYRNMVTSAAQYAQAAGVKDISEVNAAIKQLTDAVIAAEKTDASIDWDAVPQEHRAWLGQYYNEAKALGDKLWQDQKRLNPDLGYIPNYLFHYKAFNKAAIEKNRGGFIDALVAKGLDLESARDLTDAILNTDLLQGENDFSVGQGRNIPGSHKARTLNLADDVNFHEFMETNPFANIANAAKSASRFIAYEEFLGKNNQKVNELLQQMEEEGIPAAEVNKVAKQMQDYLDAESGNYKRIKNETVATTQKYLMLWTTMAGLPLATLSSVVELALSTKGLTNEQIFGKKGINKMGKQLAGDMMNTMKYWLRPKNVKGQVEKEARQDILKDLGYLNWEVGAATTTGVTETSHKHQQWLERYFNAIGLQQWTDATRAVRASIAGDFIWDKVAQIRKQRGEGEAYTNEIQEAEEQLRNLGLDVDALVNILNREGNLTPEEEAIMEQNMREGMFNFINEAVALPQSANRPLFYQNPHLALFTQFQGFIATFTANHIPKLWGEYVKRGTPAMKYNAFATMSTMILMGFVSQYLKDLLKYGEPSPYLEDAEKFQRAINASGLLGTGERITGFFFPLYETSSDSTAEWFFNTISGEAASLSNVARVAEGVGNIASGDTERGAYKLLKTTPGLGPFNQLNKNIADFFG